MCFYLADVSGRGLWDPWVGVWAGSPFSAAGWLGTALPCKEGLCSWSALTPSKDACECQQCVSLPFVNPGNLLIVLPKSSVGGTKQSVLPSAVSRLAVLQGGRAACYPPVCC